ncbi:decarboxylase [Actinosynnema sp. ALI-1.44]|uniref:decarboxylase n=1 Tax=Actinosynnema sp. ALI-1.44 TaxID=1933779 RepID=UPI00097CB6B3|nr:decarboxylase [Actinosynnema sp. ALI-1.44]ONI83205.1 decarboxylase [Actinosynnema sp. ALI-1.44]
MSARYADLARRYGTPLYVYDLDRALAARRDLRASLPEGVTLYYSFKANPHPDIARALGSGPAHEACRAELTSTGELRSALAAGFRPEECLYGGPGKTSGEIEVALAAGVRRFSVESHEDLRRVGAAAVQRGLRAECLLRINSVAPKSSSSIRMTGTPSQFGFDSETLAPLLPSLLEVEGTRVVGAHFFPLSNAMDEASLVDEFQRSVAEAARLRDELGLPVRMLDLGGGFAAPYAVPGERTVYEKTSTELAAVLDLHFPGWAEGAPEVACESGRYLVGDCGALVASVVNIKQSGGRKFVVLDAGINTLGGMAGLGRLLPLAVEPVEGVDPADLEPVSLVGPLCTPGDVLSRNVHIPSPTEGDLVTIPNTGAYGLTASLLAFLGRPAPTEVVLRGGAVVSVSRLDTQRVYS